VNNKETIILKLGSQCNVDGGIKPAIYHYVGEVLKLRETRNVAVVISGAVALGRHLLAERRYQLDTMQPETLAAVGSAALFEGWRKAFSAHDLLTGQVLVTHREIDDKTEGSALTRAYNGMQADGILPLFNVNDALEDKELAMLEYGGDNDGFAAHLATRFSAKELLLLTGADGFEVDGIVQSQVRARDVPAMGAHCYEKSGVGSGGMHSKLAAAAQAVEDSQAGLRAYIGNARANYFDILEGKVGTEVIQ
jgi:glutamate 5-kinase